jgi:dihydroneopterin aldolase
VIARVRTELAARHFNLLETLGEYVIGLMLDEFRAPWIKISIAKVGIAKGVRRVGVQIERSRA